MFFGQIEREMLSAAIYCIGQDTQLPENLHLLINQEQGNQDIWGGNSQNHVLTVVTDKEKESKGEKQTTND